MGSLPQYDTRPANPLFGPLSVWLMGDNPVDPEDRPETQAALADALGVTASKLSQIRGSKKFRKFHTDHTSNFDEVVLRRQEALDRLYELGVAGNVSALTSYLTQTKTAADSAATGAVDPLEMDPADAANLSDEDLKQLLDSKDR